MVQQDHCQQCNQRQNCSDLYEQLGKTEGASVVKRVIIAFLLPLVVFISSLVIFERIFSAVVSAGQTQSAMSFVSALLVTLACILLTKVISRDFSQDK